MVSICKSRQKCEQISTFFRERLPLLTVIFLDQSCRTKNEIQIHVVNWFTTDCFKMFFFYHSFLLYTPYSLIFFFSKAYHYWQKHNLEVLFKVGMLKQQIQHNMISSELLTDIEYKFNIAYNLWIFFKVSIISVIMWWSLYVFSPFYTYNNTTEYYIYRY